MRSLKSRLLAGMIGGMVFLLIAFSIVIYQSIRHTLLSQFDVSLQLSAQILSASVEQDKQELGLEFDVNMVPEFAAGRHSAYYEFWRNGDAAGRSPSLGSTDIVEFRSASHFPTFQSFKMPDGQRVRAVAVRFMPRAENSEPNVADQQQAITLVVAKDARRLHEQLNFLTYLLSLVSAGIVVVACVLAVGVVKRGLKPLRIVAEQIDGIKENNLSSRISDRQLPAEIVPIQRQLNSLLARLEASFERERGFNADVAHELRTPLAGLRSIIDVTLTRIRDGAEYQSALAECLVIVIKMQSMVDNLLTLARVENGQMKFGREQVRVAELVNNCWRQFSDKAAETGLVFENLVSAELICESDAAGLSTVFSNLLDNAVEYTNKGGRIWVTARKANGAPEIIFENTGNQLTSQQMSEVFECFWRGDLSRSDAGSHCGIGLALVKRIVESLGGSVRADAANGLFSVHITLA